MAAAAVIDVMQCLRMCAVTFFYARVRAQPHAEGSPRHMGPAGLGIRAGAGPMSVQGENPRGAGNPCGAGRPRWVWQGQCRPALFSLRIPNYSIHSIWHGPPCPTF